MDSKTSNSESICPPTSPGKRSTRLSERLRKLMMSEGLDYERIGARTKTYLGHIGFNETMSLLDVGCGDGMISHYLACEHGMKVVALDPYKENVYEDGKDEARNRRFVEELGDNVEVVGKSIMDYETSEKFDVIFVCHTLHHIIVTKGRFDDGTSELEEATKLFEKIRSLLKVGGELVVSEVAPIGRENCYYEQAISHVDLETKHYAWEWVKAMEKAGFNKIERTYFISAKAPQGTPLTEIFRLYVYSYMIRAKRGVALEPQIRKRIICRIE